MRNFFNICGSNYLILPTFSRFAYKTWHVLARFGTRVPKRTKWKIYCVKYRQTETDGVIFETISLSVYFR